MISIQIDTKNDAFQENCGQEVARILRIIADKMEAGETPNVAHDINGANIVSITYEK